MSLFSPFNRRPFVTLIPALCATLLLSGCSITGLHADDDFSCPLDAGYPCESTAAAYQKSVTGQYALEDEARRQAAIERQKASEQGLIANLKNTFSPAKTVPAPHDDLRVTTVTGGAGETVAIGTPDEETAAARELRRPETDSDHPREPAYDPAIVVTNLTARPERLPEEIVTIWIAPWTDAEGDFHEGEKIHARVFDARWAAARRRAEEARGGHAVVSLPFAGSVGDVGLSPLTRLSRTAEPQIRKVDDGAPDLNPESVLGIGDGAAALSTSADALRH